MNSTMRQACNACDTIDYTGELDEAGVCAECRAQETDFTAYHGDDSEDAADEARGTGFDRGTWGMSANSEFVSCDWSHPSEFESKPWYAEHKARHAGHVPGKMDECDAFLCVCGNAPSSDGFYPINRDGKYVEPTYLDWTTNEYGCARCGRRIDVTTGKVTGLFDTEAAQ